MSLNPYELRYNIYQEAKQSLMDKFYQDHQLWQDFDNWKREQETEGTTVTAKSPIACRPDFPTHEEILTESEKIYAFVQKKV